MTAGANVLLGITGTPLVRGILHDGVALAVILPKDSLTQAKTQGK